MKSNLKSANIVIPGAWNVRIFDPEWMIRNLGLKDYPRFNDKLGIGFNFLDKEFHFEFCGISFQPGRNILTIQIKDFSELPEKLNFSSEIAQKVLSTLNHTPIKALGFNLIYEFNNDTEIQFVRDVFKKELYSEYLIVSKTLQKKEKDFDINIIINPPNTDMKSDGIVNFNFHYQTPLKVIDNSVFIKHLEYAEGVLNG